MALSPIETTFVPQSAASPTKSLNQHAVLPLAVETAVAALDPDLLEASGEVHR